MPGAERIEWRTISRLAVIPRTCALAACVLTWGHAAPTRAEEGGSWLVLPSTVASSDAEPAHVYAASASLERELSVGPGVVDATQARARFERRGSTAPLMVSHGDLDALARDAQMALYHVASGLHARARQDVERALSRADRVLESLNRESIAAQQLLDACLYLVRAYLDGKEREKARGQALECRRLVPDVEPDGTMHPPHVIGMLAEAEAHLRLRTPGSLRIESKPAGCAVFVNGRRLGTAPLELPQLSPGEYRLQAECGEGLPGRVHRVVMGATRVVVRIDTRFDAVVQTSLGVSLRYASESAQAEHAFADAAEVGRIVGASYAVRVAEHGGGDASDGARVLYAERIRVADGTRVAAVRVRAGDDGKLVALDAAVRALRDGASLDLTGPTYLPLARDAARGASPSASERNRRPAASSSPPPSPTEAPSSSPSATSSETASSSPSATSSEAASSSPSATSSEAALSSPPASGRSPGEAGEEGLSSPPTIPGIALAATGGAALIAGWALWARQLVLESTYHDALDAGTDHTVALDDVEANETIAPIVGGAGALVATASLPWLLPEEPGVPTWAAVVGITGGAALVGGSIFLVRGATCEGFDIESRCTDTLSTTRFGVLLLETAIPLAGVPVTYWLRRALGGNANASLSLSPEAATVRIGGAL